MALRARQRTRHRLVLFLLRINRRISRSRKRKLRLQRRPLDRLHGHRAPVARKHRRNIILIQLSQSPPVFRREHPIQQLHKQIYYTFAGVYFRLVFILIFAIVVTLLFLLGKILEASIKIILLGWLNKLLGLVFSLFKYVLVIGLLIILFDSINGKFSLVSDEFLDSSFLYSGIRSISWSVFPYLKSLFA